MTPSEAYLIWLELQKHTAILENVREAAIVVAAITFVWMLAWAARTILFGVRK